MSRDAASHGRKEYIPTWVVTVHIFFMTSSGLRAGLVVLVILIEPSHDNVLFTDCVGSGGSGVGQQTKNAMWSLERHVAGY